MLVGVAFLLTAFQVVRTYNVYAPQCGAGKHTDDHFQGLVGRIVGGVDAHPHEWPWQVSLQMVHPRFGTIRHFCGGVLISDQDVLTAGHCVKNPLFLEPVPSVWRVRLGKQNIKMTESTETVANVSRVVHYPWYSSYNYDIAVMRLSKRLELNEYVQPACFPTSDVDFTGTKCIVSGWGKIDFHIKGASDTLKEVDATIFDNSVCDKQYREKFQIPIQPWHLCAGTLAGGKGACQGDSGGPMSCMKDGRWYVGGLVSFGPGCAKPGIPDVYTRVSYFHGWIFQQLVTA